MSNCIPLFYIDASILVKLIPVIPAMKLKWVIIISNVIQIKTIMDAYHSLPFGEKAALLQLELYSNMFAVI